MKIFCYLSAFASAATVLSTPATAQTVYTSPQGYSRITIAAADAPGESKLTSISASLMSEAGFSGAATLGTYTNLPDPSPDTQTVNVTNVTWAANQWTTEPHLAYLSVADDANNADGINPAEEAYLIIGHSTNGELTLECEFDLSTRFPANTTVTIRKAITLDSFFGDSSSSFAANDLVYLWSGSKWDSYQWVGGGSGYWAATTDGFTDVGSSTVIYPDEGLFISRTATSDIQVTIFGEVPVAPQISTIKGASFVASRYPIDTTILDTGIANENWTASDLLYVWNQDALPAPKWDSYQFVPGAPGYWAATTDGFTPVNDTLIRANSAMFVVRANSVGAENGATISNLPFDPNAQ